jgi:hypothetical protein
MLLSTEPSQMLHEGPVVVRGEAVDDGLLVFVVEVVVVLFESFTGSPITVLVVEVVVFVDTASGTP